MKITEQMLKKILITEEGIDPISVYLEDHGPRRGKATITCFDDSWTYFWGGMADGLTIETFLMSCDEYYLAGKFGMGTPQHETDYDAIPDWLKKQVLDLRRNGCIEKLEARDLYRSIPDEIDGEGALYYYEDVLSNINEEWYMELPRRNTHKYERLLAIVRLVKQAIEQLQQAAA